MKEYLQQHLQIALTLSLLALAIIGSVWLTHFNQSTLESLLNQKIAEKNAYLLNLAEITDRNGADEEVSAIIADCPRRTQYESLLVGLSSLSKKDIILAQSLSESCGSFYPERKALMVAKIEREFESYTDYVAFLKALDADKETHANQEMWKEFIALEKTRSSLLYEQSVLQKDIITLLISGSSQYSTEVVDLVRNAQEISELLTVHDHKIDALRANLMQ